MNLNHFLGTFIEKKKALQIFFLFRIIKLDIHQYMRCHISQFSLGIQNETGKFSQYVRIDKVMCTICGYYSHTLHC